MWILFIMLMCAVPSFAQVTELSPTAQSLLNNAKYDQKVVGKTEEPLGFNIAFISRFDSMFVIPSRNEEAYTDFLNINSIEMYFPASYNGSVRMLASFRFGLPLTYDLDERVYGFGLGFSSTILDSRNAYRRGLLTTFNMVYAMDMPVQDIDDTRYLLEFGARWNYFLHKHLAVVFGVDWGVGMTFTTYDLYNSYGQFYGYEYDVTALFTVSVSAGIMF